VAKKKTSTAEKLVFWFLVLILLILFRQSFLRASSQKELREPQTCKGVPLLVSYPFEGGYLEPHACSPQCDDKRQRYIVYTNGFATQCEKPPGCRDLGEDRGAICVIE